MKRTLGTCYYPEHWPREIWADDAARMAKAGLTWVRIGEFAWSRLEPKPDDLQFDWLDQAIDTLGAAGLKVVLGTPTATPPRWMIDRHPDMLALDADGRPRKFGSRRHYCFSHKGYRAEAARIVTLLAERYGGNRHIAAWQTDNEFGCHATTYSYSDAARDAFRAWLRDRYSDIAALNEAWGNVFWSMEYDDFDQIELPNLTVTEPNPAHCLAFRRFSSDQVVSFNRAQVDIIRAHSDAPIAHNYMGRITDFDHYKVGADLDIASWDSYPLGFLEDRISGDDAHRRRYAKTGDPDFQAFHHDLYRAVGRGRWWVMEQQPGPVNWAPHNPEPAPGMVRMWTWEAFAAGAEAVCYFRWRQAPMAQEQLHAGLLRPDSAPAPALAEIREVAEELAEEPEADAGKAPVALIFDYVAEWAWAIQPHGAELRYFDLALDCYRAMRGLGLTIDIVPPDGSDLSGYGVIAAPGLMIMDEELKAQLSAAPGQVLLGPRSAARDADFRIPVPLPPDFPDLDVTIARVESLHPDSPVALKTGGHFRGYREIAETGAEVIERTEDDDPALIRQGNLHYLTGWPDALAFRRVVGTLCERAGVATIDLPPGLRRRQTAREEFWFNFGSVVQGARDVTLPPVSMLRLPRRE